MSMVNLAQMILPEHFEAKNIRVCIHKVFAVKLNDETTLAFYKEYLFQIVDTMSRSNMSGEWQDYHLASKSTTKFRQNAARDLRVIYICEPMLFAWKWSASKRS